MVTTLRSQVDPTSQGHAFAFWWTDFVPSSANPCVLWSARKLMEVGGCGLVGFFTAFFKMFLSVLWRYWKVCLSILFFYCSNSYPRIPNCSQLLWLKLFQLWRLQCFQKPMALLLSCLSVYLFIYLCLEKDSHSVFLQLSMECKRSWASVLLVPVRNRLEFPNQICVGPRFGGSGHSKTSCQKEDTKT